MGLSSNKPGIAKKPNRKQLRKSFRQEKKARKNEWFMNRGKTQQSKQLITDNNVLKNKKENEQVQGRGARVITTEEKFNKEQKAKKKLEKAMQKQRKDQLLKANKKEDQTIKKLEKQLKLHKRKTKNIPKSFSSDGLDFLLEVCDPEYMSNAANSEQDLNQANEDFDEDFALMTGEKSEKSNKNSRKKNEKNKKSKLDQLKEFSDLEDDFDDEYDDDFNKNNADISEETDNFSDISLDMFKSASIKEKNSKSKKKLKSLKKREDDSSADKKHKATKVKLKSTIVDSESELLSENDNLGSDVESEIIEPASKKIKIVKKRKREKQERIGKEKVEIYEELSDGSHEDRLSDVDDTEREGNSDINNSHSGGKKDGVWEDIYGRLRAKDGSIINQIEENSNVEGKYIPPAIRAKMATSEDKKRDEKLAKLKRQLKGLLNRLAESNMHNIASQIEGLYMNNSRNDMNETLTGLMMDSLVSNVATPNKLLMEHVLLVAILHANVGTEIGAHYLQTMAKKFDDLTKIDQDVSNKTLDNTVNILAQLYNFKVFEAKLLYEILHRLSEKFEEKNIDCILHVLKNVGFSLRKDDPIALKNLILELQKQAASASEGKVSNSRVKFLLDILMAIKNNNMTKIPNFDPTYSEHLKKIMKGFIRKGNYVTQLNISLEDLLKADERGKWWVVGSAWTGKTNASETKESTSKMADNFSQKLLNLARKQRMNTDTRRDIFCIIMSAEDYIDAFEKLLRLGLKNQQEREIIHVILHCCLQEKVYNPYYAVLAQKFCEYDRKFQMTIKYSSWDKLKALGEHSGNQISNLAKLLTHLFIEKGLPISTLKIVEFSELDKITLRFIRQILLGILLHDDLEPIQEIFGKIAHSEKLKMFRESLRLFIHHFLLRNLKTDGISEEKKHLLEERAALIEKLLSVKDGRIRL